MITLAFGIGLNSLKRKTMWGGLRPGVISCSPDRQRLLQCRLTSLAFLHQRFGICDCAFEIWRHLVFGIWNFKAAQVSSAASWFVRTGSICFIWSHLIQIFQCSYLKEVSTGWFYIHIFATEDMAGGTEVSFVELILIFRVIFSFYWHLSSFSTFNSSSTDFCLFYLLIVVSESCWCKQFWLL